MIINSMMGLGDNIYQRAYIKKIKCDLWLNTPWPELYKDLPNVHFMASGTKLRTQEKNEKRQAKTIYSASPKTRNLGRVSYSDSGIIPSMTRFFGFKPDNLDMPDFGKPPVDGSYIVVRPVTVRAEWVAAARNPLPEYVSMAAKAAKDAGYKIVSVADIEEGKEWIIGDEPYADIKYHKGELSVSELMALTQHAKGVISPIGWAVPACIAARVKLFCICGGQGGYNHPSKITSPDIDCSTVTFAEPDKFCMCKQREHNCDKTISGIERKVSEWIASLE